VATMLSTYVDRGIIKWSPFDALVGYQAILEEMKYKRGKKEIPVLTDDAYETLNRALQIAYQTKQEIGVRYYLDGYIKSTHGLILKIDYTFKRIKLSTCEEFKAEDVIDIDVCIDDEL
jgi:aminoglycoside phosphotransferase family enzyme